MKSRTIMNSSSLIFQLIYGSKTCWNDPVQFSWNDSVQFSFAYGGKDGVPFPIDRNTFDNSITFLSEAIEGGELSWDKIDQH